MKAGQVLETVLYADDLEAAEEFYSNVLGLKAVSRKRGRQVFFRCGDAMLLIFNPSATSVSPANDQLPVPVHGAKGSGHLCFSASGDEIDVWIEKLTASGVEIESDFEWPQGGRSVYFRDPAGNSIEFAEPKIWGFV